MRAFVRRNLIASALMMGLVPTAAPAQTPAPPDANLYIIYPRDGQRIRGAFPVRFGLRNMGVTRAGDPTPNMGHHHLLVDVDEDQNVVLRHEEKKEAGESQALGVNA